jgi:hypothetical protein
MDHGVPGGFVKRVGRNRWVLHAPGRFVHMGCLDPVLEKEEKENNLVKMSEARKWLDRNRSQKEAWDAATEEAGGRQAEEPAVYICEVQSTTYDSEDDSAVMYNIKCV